MYRRCAYRGLLAVLTVCAVVFIVSTSVTHAQEGVPIELPPPPDSGGQPGGEPPPGSVDVIIPPAPGESPVIIVVPTTAPVLEAPLDDIVVGSAPGSTGGTVQDFSRPENDRLIDNFFARERPPIRQVVVVLIIVDAVVAPPDSEQGSTIIDDILDFMYRLLFTSNVEIL